MDRWCGPFATPNVAGLEMALCAIALWTFAAQPVARMGRAAVPLRLVAASAALTAVVLVAWSSSRAGGLALLAGAVTLGALRAVGWRWVLAIGLAYTACAVAFGLGDRIASIPKGDPSTVDRLTLWRCSLALIADHPWFGVGDALPSLLGHWYLPDGMRVRFSTALNDLLTAAAHWGIPAAALLCGILGSILHRAIRRGRDGDRIAALAVALSAVLLVAGLFQAHLFAPWHTVRWSALAIGLGLIFAARLSTTSWSTSWRVGMGCTLAALACLGSLLPLGDAAWHLSSPHGMHVAEPRNRDATGLVVLIQAHGSDEQATTDFARRLQHHGLALATTTTGPDSAAWSALGRLTSGHTGIAVIAARADGARLWEAWRMGHLPSHTASIVIDPDSAPQRTTPRDGITRGPLLIMHIAGNSVPDLRSLQSAVHADQAFGTVQLGSGRPFCDLADAWSEAESWWDRHRTRPTTTP